MRRTLYLHSGVHRTATTSFQGFMFRNFRDLMARGIFYPYRVRRHVALMDRLMPRRPEVAPQSVAEVAAEMKRRAEAKSQELDRIVLSDEGMSVRHDLSPLAAFGEHFDVRVIFAMRRQDLWLESFYQQNVKFQWDPDLAHATLEEFLARRGRFHWIDYDARVEMLEEVFGPKNLELVVFEKENMPGGPVAELCRRIGLEDLSGLSDPPHANYSLSLEMLEVLRHLPLDQMEGPVRQQVINACTRVAPGRGDSNLLLSSERRAAILEEHAASNARLARRRFGRNALFTEPLPPANAPLTRPELPASPEALLEEILGPVLLHMAEAGSLGHVQKK